MSSTPDEPLFLHDDDEEIKVDKPKGFWKILIVDDDQEIHAVTKMAAYFGVIRTLISV